MRCGLFVLALTTVVLKPQASAQTALASTGTARFLTAAGLATALEKAAVSPTRKSARLLAGTPHDVRLDHLDAVNNASVHPKFGELYIIRDGGGTLITGGALINGDGNADLITVNRGFVGDGRGHFAAAPASLFAPGRGIWKLAVADVNGDGRTDVAASHLEADTVTVLLAR